MLVTALTIIYGDNADPATLHLHQNQPGLQQRMWRGIHLLVLHVHGSPITGIEVFAGGSGDFPAQPGYQRLPYDLNKGARGMFIYVYYTKNPRLAPVVDICVIQSDSPRIYPPDDTWRRIGQDCSQGAGGKFTYIAYKQADVQMVLRKVVMKRNIKLGVTCYQAGEACNEQMEISACDLVSESTGEKVVCSVKKTDSEASGQYEISYQATNRGRHQLHIKVEGEYIKGSSFPVSVKLPVKKLGTPIKTITGIECPRGVAVNRRGEVILAETMMA